MTLEEFRKSRKAVTPMQVAFHLAELLQEDSKGFYLYCPVQLADGTWDGYHIQVLDDGRYYLSIQHDEWESSTLADLEVALYTWEQCGLRETEVIARRLCQAAKTHMSADEWQEMIDTKEMHFSLLGQDYLDLQEELSVAGVDTQGLMTGAYSYAAAHDFFNTSELIYPW